MDINPSSANPLYESQAKINLDKLFNSSPANAQAQIAYEQFMMIAKLIGVFAALSKTRNLCGLAMLKAGFNSADETANTGTLIGIGGLVLGATGIAQGISKFEEAKGIAKATEIRNNKLAALDEKFKNKDLNKDITVEIEAIDEPCSHASNVNDDLVLEVEEDVLSAEQNKMQDKEEDLKQESIAQESHVFDDVEKNKRIKLVNKEYEIRTDGVKADASKLHAIGTPGQAAYYVAQGLSEHQKAKSQKESLIQQVQQDNQNQQGNTADGVKREIDKLSDFDPFQRNSASQR